MRENNIVSQFKQHRVIYSLLYSYVFHVATFKKMKLTAELGYEHLLEAKFFSFSRGHNKCKASFLYYEASILNKDEILQKKNI